MPRKQPLNAVATLVNDVSPGRRILQVVPYGWDFPEHRPGQFVSLGLPGSAPRCAAAEPELLEVASGELIKRTYSIASSPLHREYLEFYVTLVPGGSLTPRLFELKIGDGIWLSKKPTGHFAYDDSLVTEGANLVLCTSGGGLGPLISMLVTDLKLTPERRVVLIHSVRHSWDLGYRSLLMTMQDLRPNFTYLPVISQPEDEIVPWTGELGGVQDVWKGSAIEKAWAFRPAAGHTHVFLCGSQEMTDSMVELLKGEDFTVDTESEHGQIHVENFS